MSGLSLTERMAAGWFLAINTAERKRLTVSEVRCAHGGCLLAAIVTIDRTLYVLGITDSTRTETHPTALLTSGAVPSPRPGRLTVEAVQAMTLDEFLQGFRARPRGFSTADLAQVDTGHRHGWLDEWERVKARRAVIRARCKHLNGWVPVGAFDLDTKAVRVAELDNIDRLV